MTYIPVHRLQGRFIELCWDWIRKHKGDKTDLAKAVGVKAPRIYELMNETRPLSMYYIKLFVQGGIFGVKDIYDEAPESAEESENWDYIKMFEDTEVQRALAKALRGSLDRKDLLALLKTHYPKTGEEKLGQSE